MDGDLARFAGEVAPSRPAVAGAAPADAPDIYVLLLDGHLRPNKVQEMTGVDGSAFAVELRERGFDVAEASRSNYVFTIQSVPSFLSGAYLDDLLASDPAGESYADGRRWARERVDGAAIVADLRALGYEIVSIPSEFEETSLRTADRVLEAGQVNELELLAFGNTLAGPLVEAIRPSFFSDQHRDRIRAQVELVAGVAAEPAERPRFVWVHVPSPHAPLVFAADGSPLPPTPLDGFFDDTAESTGLDRAEFGRRYAEQQAHVDELALAAIDAILAASDEPPVILAISDHGSRSSLVVGDVERADPDELTANLVASLTPGHPGLVPDPVTLVNVLGPVVDAYLGTSHPVQPDRILLPDPGFPDFREIPNPDREATPAPVGLGRPPVSPPVSADAPVGLP
jgi:hypothetical protein